MYIPHGKKLLLEVIGIVLAGIVLLAGFFIWRLTQGPFNANFLKPFIESTLTHHSGLDVHIGTVTLAWEGHHTPFLIDISDIAADRPDRQGHAVIDDLKLELAGGLLLKGEIRPVSLIVTHPQLWLEPRASSDGTSSPANLTSMLAPDKQSMLTDWQRILVENVEVHFRNAAHEDIGQMRNGNFQAERSNNEIRARLTADAAIGDHTAPLVMTAQYTPQDGILSLNTNVDQFRLDVLSALSPALNSLQDLQIPVSLQLDVKTDAHLSLKSAHLESHVMPGQIVDSDYFDAPAPVTGGHLDIVYDAAPERLELKDFTIDLDQGALSATGAAATDGGTTHFDVTTTFGGIAIDSFSTYWPKGLSKGGRLWVTENLSKGVVTDGTMHLAGSAPRDNLANTTFDKIEGGFHVDNALVHYFGELPSVENVAGDVKFDDKAMTITLAQGHVSDVRMTGGTVIINGLSANDQDIKIDVATNGSMATYLGIINHDPLDYAKKLKIDPQGVSGTASVNLHMAFPLLADIATEQMQIAVKANLQSVTLPHMVGGDAIANLTGLLDVTTATMRFKGSGIYKTVALNADWQQNFNHQQGIDSDATIDGILSDKDRAALGLDFPQRLSGPVKINAHYVDKGASETADLSLDLTRADFKIYEIGYEKAPRVPSNAAFTLLFDRKGLNAIDNIDIKGEHLAITGAAKINPENNHFDHLMLNRFQAGDTDLNGTVDRMPDGGLKILIRGRSFDIGPLLHKKQDPDETPTPSADNAQSLQIDFDIGRIETSPQSGLDTAKGILALLGAKWQHAEISAMAAGTPFSFSYAPQSTVANASYVLAIDAPDAGKALTALSLTNSMRGGVLHIEGQQDVTSDGTKQPLNGHAEIQNFRLVNTPFLGRLLNLLSLTGLTGTFSGKGIAFDILSIDFQMNDDKVVLQDGKMEGASIGMTLKGTEDRNDGTLDLSGMVVPAYSANQWLNAVPLLGPLLTGGAGQGIFAATYRITGSFDDPKVSINPLSVLAPGVLRDLFFGRKAPADLPETTE